MQSPLQEEIESLTQAGDHLAFIERMLTHETLDKVTRTQLAEQSREVHKRLEDPNLYMAVVGEMSTGKTTFINALLGDNLLKTHALTMTTAAATVVKYGPELSLSAVVRTDTAYGRAPASLVSNSGVLGLPELEFLPDNLERMHSRLLQMTPADEPITVPWLPNVQGLSLRALLHRLTADEGTGDSLAEEVLSMTLTHPASFLQNGIHVIDTPGADATIAAHTQVMRQAVEHSDAAIIMIPAKQIVSQTLQHLLTDATLLQPFLHRCVFVVTGMDLIRKREHDRLLSEVHNRLSPSLKDAGMEGEDFPPIFPASAQAVVDSFSGVAPVVPNATDRQTWQARFAQLQTDLLTHLTRQRALTIAESILRLLEDLLTVITTYLTTLWNQYNAERDALDVARIRNLHEFANEQIAECDQRLNTVIHEALTHSELAVDSCREWVIKKVRRGITDATTLEALQEHAQQDIAKIVEKQQRRLQRTFKQHLQEIEHSAQAVSEVFDQRFQEAYARLRLLKRELNGKAGRQTLGQVSASDLTASARASEAFSGPSVGKMVTGGLIGAYLGSVLFPGVGTVIGAWVGSQVAKWFGPSLEDRKETLWNDVRPRLNTSFLDVKEGVRDQVMEYGHGLRRAVEARIQEHVTQYSNVVDTMIQEYDKEYRRLQKVQRTLEAALHELQQRQHTVRMQRDHLRTARRR